MLLVIIIFYVRRSVQRGASELVEDGNPRKHSGETKVSLLLKFCEAVSSFMSALLTDLFQDSWAFQLRMRMCTSLCIQIYEQIANSNVAYPLI